MILMVAEDLASSRAYRAAIARWIAIFARGMSFPAAQKSPEVKSTGQRKVERKSIVDHANHCVIISVFFSVRRESIQEFVRSLLIGMNCGRELPETRYKSEGQRPTHIPAYWFS